MTHWVRLWEDMPTDPKWRIIAKRSGRPACEVIALFTMMMTNAGASDPRGSLSSWDDEAAAMVLDMEIEHVAAIREAMQGRVLEGDALLGWEKRQPKREDASTDRVKAFRERQAAMKRDETQGNARPKDETQRNAPDKMRIDTDKNKSPPSLSRRHASEKPKAEKRDGWMEVFEQVLRAFPASGVPHAQTKVLQAIQATDEAEWPAVVAGAKAYAISYRAKPTEHPISLDRFVTERRWANYATGAAPVAVMLTIHQDSPEGRALDAEWRATKGKPPPWSNGRWYVPAPFPAPLAEPTNETRQ